MVEWNKYGILYTNKDEVYRDFFNRTGQDSVRQFGLITYGDPSLESFLSKIQITQHIYEVGDNLSKIAYKHYGQARYWWVLAWFNSKPTDSHCEIGDTILVPTPLSEAISQAYDIVEL
jgi:nucleoid-associated protein YgaU